MRLPLTPDLENVFLGISDVMLDLGWKTADLGTGIMREFEKPG
jgi:hypothetical protein